MAAVVTTTCEIEFSKFKSRARFALAPFRGSIYSYTGVVWAQVKGALATERAFRPLQALNT